jgi:hypothetical protein
MQQRIDLRKNPELRENLLIHFSKYFCGGSHRLHGERKTAERTLSRAANGRRRRRA